MPWPTWDQIKGVAERLVTISLASVLSLAVSKGWITKQQAVDYGLEWGPLFLALISAWYGWKINQPRSIIQSAAALPGTTVVTLPSIAGSTPESNIVSVATNEVVPRG